MPKGRAKAQLKVETEGEEKINNSYQSIYKQFIEILNTLRVVPVETTGTAFDPLGSNQAGSKLSRGFQLGDRLLRPSMVKVSANPGPAKPLEPEKKLGDGETIAADTVEDDGGGSKRFL
ncbi:hypothetical protein QQ045_019798 [Rhodiola kirilowii]